MIDVEGRTRLAGQGSVLRGCRMISVGKIAALTQVRMRADLTTFLARCAALRNLSSAGRSVPWTRPPRDSFRLSGTPERRSYTRPVLFVVGYRLGAPFQDHSVCSARRFLTSSSAWRWVENEPKRSTPMRTYQPTVVGSTRTIVVISCLSQPSVAQRRSASCRLCEARRHTA
jgi:hypothetical protein